MKFRLIAPGKAVSDCRLYAIRTSELPSGVQYYNAWFDESGKHIDEMPGKHVDAGFDKAEVKRSCAAHLGRQKVAA